VNPEGRVLLLRGWDPLRPRDRFWFTVGGGAHRGEPLRAAAAREMGEEVGVHVDEARLGQPIEASTIEWTQLGVHIVQDQEYYAVAVPADMTVSLAGMDWMERLTVSAHAWLTADELAAHPTRCADPRLPDTLRLAVAAVLGRGPQAGRGPR
jgi:8-oxo-dGTP pyrophosphatase MutT (NUDIX family)